MDQFIVEPLLVQVQYTGTVTNVTLWIATLSVVADIDYGGWHVEAGFGTLSGSIYR